MWASLAVSRSREQPGQGCFVPWKGRNLVTEDERSRWRTRSYSPRKQRNRKRWMCLPCAWGWQYQWGEHQPGALGVDLTYSDRGLNRTLIWESHTGSGRKSMFERESPFNLWMCLPRTLRVALPKTRVPARCPGVDLTHSDRGLDRKPNWEPLWQRQRNHVERERENSFDPWRCLPYVLRVAFLTDDQSTKQRGRNGSLQTSEVISSWLNGHYVQGVTWAQLCRVTPCPEGGLTFY